MVLDWLIRKEIVQMNKIKIGIIGTGVGIRTHLKGFRMIEDAEVIAIAGSCLERSQEFAQKFDIPIACADYKELCDLPEIDLVCVTTPNRFHHDMIQYALNAGKHIIAEKPLSDNIDEVRVLTSNVKGYNKLAIVDHQLRFNPYIRKIKELISNGTLGKIYSIRIQQQASGFADPNTPWNWSFDAKEGGGVRLAMISHFVDLMQFWFGKRSIINVNGYMNPITKVRKDSCGNIHEVYASAICSAQINFSDEMTAFLITNAGSYAESRFDISIFGDKGELVFSLQEKLVLYLREDLGTRHIVAVDGVYQDEKENNVSIFSGSFRYFAPQIIDAIMTGDRKVLADAATFFDAEYNLTVLDAVKKAANKGVSVSFSKGENSYV